VKSKPVVMQSLFVVHTSYVVDFIFTNNITILTGDSASGKTMIFSFIRECTAINSNILCLNYLDYRKDIKGVISEVKGKLIVIDNADILLDDVARKYISLDGENQYLIIGRNPRNLFATKENLFNLISEQNGEQIIFHLESYL